jgi:hypothetical protein
MRGETTGAGSGCRSQQLGVFVVFDLVAINLFRMLDTEGPHAAGIFYAVQEYLCVNALPAVDLRTERATSK